MKTKSNSTTILQLKRFRKNQVFPVDQSSHSTSALTVINCTKVSTRSDHLKKKIANLLVLKTVPRFYKKYMFIEEFNNKEEITALFRLVASFSRLSIFDCPFGILTKRVHESGGCRLYGNCDRNKIDSIIYAGMPKVKTNFQLLYIVS